MSKTSLAQTIGYYTVVQDDQTGWTGGLLILNPGGRPLEFQCTLPIRPTKTHEILYGSTLRDHLVGEVIGRVLMKKAKTPIGILCCDQIQAASLAEHTAVPIALSDDSVQESETMITDATLPGWVTTPINDSSFWVAVENLDATQEIAKSLGDLPSLTEPFDRIREAIREAHSQIATRRSAEAA